MKKFQLTRKTFLIICNFILICLLIYFYAWEFFQDYVETLEIFEENPNQGVLTKKINCRDFSDLTSFCLYENICVENDEILYLTNDKKLYNIPFEYQGFIRQWDHYESTYKNGSVVNDKLNNPLPYRSFLKGKYVSSKKWNRSKIHHEDCRAIVGFDWKFGDNIFHFASKISTLFLFQYYNKHENFCKRFSHIKLMDRNSTEISEWQRNFYELASGVKLNENNTEFGNEPKRNQPKLQCYKYLFVAGNSLYMFTGPKEAIEFRKRLSTELNIFYERSRVVLVKRKNRLIVNQNELEEFLKLKFGEYNVDVVYFEELSFIQQVEKVTKAKLLIGVHGAGLTNSIFLPTLSTVIEITPPHFHYPLYERISIQSGHIFFRFVTQYHPSIHQNNSYLNVNSIDCSYNISCLVFWRESPIFVNITKFSVIIEQAMETF